jgi:LMBR1 domain-containing protein 1
MVSIYLAIVAGVVGLLVLLSMLLVLAHFGHPDDKEEAVLPKIIVVCFVAVERIAFHVELDAKNLTRFSLSTQVFALWSAVCTILVLPLDVANASSSGGLDMSVLWQVCYIVLAVLVCAVIPFAFFYYEADDTDDEGNQSDGARFGAAIKMTLIFAVSICVLIFLMYNYLGTTDIPVVHYVVSGTCTDTDMKNNAMGNTVTYTCGLMAVSYTDSNGKVQVGSITKGTSYAGCVTTGTVAGTPGCSQDPSAYWSFQVTLPIYIMAVMSFLGYFLFSCFTGIGLMALPFDLIFEWVNRPIPMKADEYARKKIDVGSRAAKLLEIGREMLQNAERPNEVHEKSIRLTRSSGNKFELAVYALKREHNVLIVSHKLKGGNPLWPFFLLILGIISISISLSWLVHIAIYMLPDTPPTPFLNNMFISLQTAISGFPLFGVIAFSIYCLYLLWCTIKGAFRFGMRIPFCMKVYPMEVGNTYLNGFLANTWIICLTTMPCVQFCVAAFPIYTRSSSVNVLLGSQVKYLKFFRWFWVYPVFTIMILLFAGITAGFLMNNPNDRGAEIEADLKRMAEDEEDLNV